MWVVAPLLTNTSEQQPDSASLEQLFSGMHALPSVAHTQNEMRVPQAHSAFVPTRHAGGIQLLLAPTSEP